MIPAKFIQLIDKLIQKTELKEVIWSKTSRASEFQIVLSKGAITTDKWYDEDTGTNWIDFAILNDRGENVDRLYFSKETSPNDYLILEQLNAVAYRSYFKIDETINSIFEELNNTKIIGKTRAPGDDLPF